MRTSPLRPLLSDRGVSFATRHGIEIVSVVNDLPAEYHRIRDGVGVTDFSYLQKYRIPEASAIDFLDRVVAGNVARVRFGRLLHTFIANAAGELVADCYIANNDEEFILLTESLVPDEQLDEILASCASADAGVENLTRSHAVISVDGYQAWAVMREVFGSDVLGLPYLSIENYPFGEHTVRLMRGGKTSEFGYLLMVPDAAAAELMNRLLELAAQHDGGLCGCAIHDELRLEGRFFNIYAEGTRVKNPLELGLQWMIDFDKDDFIGRAPILAQRDAGCTRKIIGIQADASLEGLRPGSAVFAGSDQVATVEAVCFSHQLNKRIGLALFNADVAFAGLSFTLDGAQGPEIRTISMPPIMPKSLSVKLDEV